MSELAARLSAASRLLRRIFTPLALAFLIAAAWASKDVVSHVVTAAVPSLLAAAIICWAATHLLAPLSTLAILHGFGVSPGFSRIISIHVGRLPARYLPGGIWHTVSRAVDLRALGVGRAELVAMVALENALPLATALVAGGLCLSMTAGATELSGPWILAGGLVALLCGPRLLRFAVRTGTPLPLRDYLATVAAIAAFWAVGASSFILFLSAFPQAQITGRLTSVLAAYWLSWSAGFLAVFAPQGLGVFEAVAGLLLQSTLPFASIALLVAGFRACMLCGDTLAYLAGRLAGVVQGHRRTRGEAQ